MRDFALAVVGLWVVLGIAGITYSSQQHIPSNITYAVLAAILVEAALYISPGFKSVRRWFESLPEVGRAGLLWVAALPPFLIYSLGPGTFAWSRLGVLIACAGLISLWYIWLPRKPVADVLLVAFVAFLLLSDVLKKVYPPPYPKLRVEFFGQMMMIRTVAFAALSIRKLGGVNFGFRPGIRDWWIGVKNFVFLAPLAFGLGFAMHYFQLRSLVWPQAALTFVGTFLGMLLVVALSEELFARGMVQPAISGWLKSERWGLIVTSVLFGLVHLPFRFFPNWKHVLLAALLGYFCGRAYQQSGGIRAGMVTHALAATAWRVFLV